MEFGGSFILVVREDHVLCVVLRLGMVFYGYWLLSCHPLSALLVFWSCRLGRHRHSTPKQCPCQSDTYFRHFGTFVLLSQGVGGVVLESYFILHAILSVVGQRRCARHHLLQCSVHNPLILQHIWNFGVIRCCRNSYQVGTSPERPR